jgi:hypothetical protein
MHWRVLVALASFALAIAVVVTVAVEAPEWWPVSEPDTHCDRADAPAQVGEAVPVGDKLVVVEQGFSAVGPWAMSLGAVVANRSNRAAYRTTVTLRLLDSGGGLIVALPEQVVPVILPGERLPVGGAVDDVPGDPPAVVARFSVEFGTTHWVRVEGRNRLFRRYDGIGWTEASNAAPDRQRGEEEGGSQSFWLGPNMENRPCSGLSADTAALVYRNTAGTVIGGEVVRHTGAYCDGAHHGDSVSGVHVPRATDLHRTQVAVYCDVSS